MEEIKFYSIFKKDNDLEGVGYSLSKDLFFLPESGPFTSYQVQDVLLKDGHLTDYLANDLGVRLCSEKFRSLISPFLKKGTYEWLPVNVYENNNPTIYYILHFISYDDVLDFTKSILVADSIVKPVLSQQKCNHLKVFTYKGDEGLSLIVNETVRELLLEKNITGIDLQRIASI